MVNNEVFEMIASKDVFSTSWVKIDGLDYKAGLVICVAMVDDEPVFCEISDILLVESHVYVLTNKLLTENFDEHYHAFQVQRSNEKFIVKMSDIKFQKPFDIQNSYRIADVSLYVVPSFTMF